MNTDVRYFGPAKSYARERWQEKVQRLGPKAEALLHELPVLWKEACSKISLSMKASAFRITGCFPAHLDLCNEEHIRTALQVTVPRNGADIKGMDRKRRLTLVDEYALELKPYEARDVIERTHVSPVKHRRLHHSGRRPIEAEQSYVRSAMSTLVPAGLLSTPPPPPKKKTTVTWSMYAYGIGELHNPKINRRTS